MEIEDRIRSRIEAILVNDARSFSELRKMASGDEPLESDLLDDERNLYHRIINGYRTAVGEVNRLLEQTVGSLSGFYRILETIKDKRDFQEICARMVECILHDFEADYCSILFRSGENPITLEGIREDRRFMRMHSGPSLLGSNEFEREVTGMAAQDGQGCLKIDDVYKEARFNAIDFPSVVRSVLCLPVISNESPVGFIILSHSLPSYFHDNHVRVIKIVGSLVAHLWLLHGERVPDPKAAGEPSDAVSEDWEGYSVVLMDFKDAYDRGVPLGKEDICQIRRKVQSILEGKETVLFHRERELLVFLPGVSSEVLPARVRALREAFAAWQSEHADSRRNARVSIGYSVCQGDEDLSRTLEMAALVMHPDEI